MLEAPAHCIQRASERRTSHKMITIIDDIHGSKLALFLLAVMHFYELLLIISCYCALLCHDSLVVGGHRFAIHVDHTVIGHVLLDWCYRLLCFFCYVFTMVVIFHILVLLFQGLCFSFNIQVTSFFSWCF